MIERFVIVKEEGKYYFVHEVVPETMPRSKQYAVCKVFSTRVAKWLKDS